MLRYSSSRIARAAGVSAFRRLPWTETQARLKLRAALLGGGLHLAYQPIVHAENAEIEGFEALVRWDDPGVGAITPDEFIPFAERRGLITRLGDWVAREASAQAASWPQLQQQGTFVSVNVSPVELLSGSFSERLQSILEDTRLPPRHLLVEITETSAIERHRETVRELEAVRRLGVRVAADDVGEGYMKLRVVSRLPIDVIKIPRRAMASRSRLAQRRFLAALVRYAQRQQIQTIVEGVETWEQFQRALEAGCDSVQGRYVSWPLTPEGVEEFLVSGWVSPGRDESE